MSDSDQAGKKSKFRKFIKYSFIGLGSIVALFIALAICGYLVFFRFHGDVEKIFFESGEVTMSGLFVKPEGAGPFPVVILLHGSGRSPGDGPPVRTMANAFLKEGIGFLSYDKRGVGLSGGTFKHNAYDEFIEDGNNAVRYLKSRDDVNHEAIGLLGSSEGGWLAPKIAADTNSIAFIVNRVGPAVSWIDTNQWEFRHDLIDAGLTGEILEDAVRVRGNAFRFLLKAEADPSLVDSEGWRQIDSEIAAFDQTYGKNEVWLNQATRYGQKLADLEKLYKSLTPAIRYDPQPYIEQLDIPMLYIYAENDRNVPTADCVEYLEGLQERSHPNIEFDVIPGVGHTMMSPAAMLEGGYDPAFIRVIGPWAAEKIK